MTRQEWLALVGRVKVDGREVAMYLVAIDGAELEDEWQVQKGTSTSGASTVWRGTKIVEGVTLTFEAPDDDTFPAVDQLFKLFAPASPGSKPPTRILSNPMLDRVGVTRVSRKKWKGPYPTKDLNIRVDLTVIQYRPSKKAQTGPQDPSDPNDDKPDQETPKTAADKEIDELLQKAAAL